MPQPSYTQVQSLTVTSRARTREKTPFTLILALGAAILTARAILSGEWTWKYGAMYKKAFQNA